MVEKYLNERENVILNNRVEVIDYIIKYDLLDILITCLNHVEFNFRSKDIVLSVAEPFLVVTVYTDIDGFLASSIIDKMDELLIGQYGDDFLNHIIISPEWF